MMKNLLALLFICASVTVFAGGKPETATIKTKNDCSHCKVCETCGGLIEKEMYNVKGIKKVVYNEADMTITVVYKADVISLDDIRNKISKLGFPADDVPADKEGFEKRDTCCKGQE